MTITHEMTLAEVAALQSNDVDAMTGEIVTVAESGDYLDEYYQTTPRWNYRGGVTGMFWDKVLEVAEILEQAEVWPFQPLAAKDGKLYDGHHRANAALLVNWDKPIPVDIAYFSQDSDYEGSACECTCCRSY